VRSILQFHRLTSQQTQIGLVNQGGALQGVIRALGLEVIVRQTPKLFVDQRYQGTESVLVALLPLLQQLGDLPLLVIGHRL
jgi:hypothetical protein